MNTQKTFLKAYWKNLLFYNYTVDPGILKPYLPAGTELDFYDDSCYVSLVGFLFLHTKLMGVSIPFHQEFEEFNLRFYVRVKENNEWKRGVVFVKEIVPRRMICFTAKLIYGEHYYYHPMRHSIIETTDNLTINYDWKVQDKWNYVKALASKPGVPLIAETEEAFITEHYWGYTKINSKKTSEYNVVHPKWIIHKVYSYDLSVDYKTLYGKAFVPFLDLKPTSVFMAEGSEVEIRTRRILEFT